MRRFKVALLRRTDSHATVTVTARDEFEAECVAEGLPEERVEWTSVTITSLSRALAVDEGEGDDEEKEGG